MIRVISLTDNFEVESDKLLFSGYKPIVAIAQGPDNYIYFSTINSIERIVEISPEFLIEPTTDEYRSVFIFSIIAFGIIVLVIIIIIRFRRKKFVNP